METKAMRYGEPDITLEHDSRTVETTLDQMEAATRRLEGTDYVAVAVTGINGEWLEIPPRLGDEIRLEVVATCVEAGRKITDDGIQATAKLKVTGVNVTDS